MVIFKKYIYKSQPIHYNVLPTQSCSVLCLKDKALGKQILSFLSSLPNNNPPNSKTNAVESYELIVS